MSAPQARIAHINIEISPDGATQQRQCAALSYEKATRAIEKMRFFVIDAVITVLSPPRDAAIIVYRYAARRHAACRATIAICRHHAISWFIINRRYANYVFQVPGLSHATMSPRYDMLMRAATLPLLRDIAPRVVHTQHFDKYLPHMLMSSPAMICHRYTSRCRHTEWQHSGRRENRGYARHTRDRAAPVPLIWRCCSAIRDSLLRAAAVTDAAASWRPECST